MPGNYRIVVAAKTTSSPGVSTQNTPFPPDPNSQASTIHTVAREITLAGGTAFAHAVDVRSPDSIAALFCGTLAAYGRLDAVVYNAGAIWWASVEKTPFKRFKLMQEVNADGCYAAVQEAIGVWKDRGWKGRFVTVSPPIYSRFFKGKGAYSMGKQKCQGTRDDPISNGSVGKIGMSVLTKALSMDWIREGKKEMAICSIWPAAVSCWVWHEYNTNIDRQLSQRLPREEQGRSLK